MNRTAYENRLSRAINDVEATMNHIREVNAGNVRIYVDAEILPQVLTREKYIAQRKLSEIKKALEVLQENSWYAQKHEH